MHGIADPVTVHGMARPKILGDPVSLRFPPDVLAALKARADNHGETLRQYLTRNLTAAVAADVRAEAERKLPPKTGRLR